MILRNGVVICVAQAACIISLSLTQLCFGNLPDRKLRLDRYISFRLQSSLNPQSRDPRAAAPDRRNQWKLIHHAHADQVRTFAHRYASSIVETNHPPRL
jgi:hypothetical protein